MEVSHIRILAVDDDPTVRSLLELSLGLDHEVLTAADGQAGLAVARADAGLDAVVLDVKLPGMDGLEVARRLRADDATAALPLVMLSARVTEADVAAGMTAGADAYVTKPFDPFELEEVLRGLVQRSG